MEAIAYPKCLFCGADSKGSRYCCAGCEQLACSPVTPTQVISKFSHLDLPNIKNQYAISSGSFNYRIFVEGLHCASCIHLLEKLPEFDPQIREARVDFADSSLAVKVDAAFSLAHLADLLTSWGYRPHFLMPDEDAKQKILTENKALLKKLAITGACAGNIMLFVIPVYAGLEGSWKTAFNWMSFLLFLPIVFYSGTQFYQGAWNSLRYRQVNVDFPITVALLSGFALSTINLVRGDGAIYFDSTASFIFLILCARYYLRRSQQKFLDSKSMIDEIANDQYQVLTSDGVHIVGVKEIQMGQRLQLKVGQTCPVDGVLATAGLVDLAVLNGEPLPRRFESGMKILAGSKILSPSLTVEVSAPFEATYLSSLLMELQSQQLEKSKFVSMTDQIAQWLIWSVSLLALFYFLFHFQSNFQESYNRALALIVLACPCALAFGTPLAFNLALKKAHKMGILVKNSGAFERLWNIRNVIFDKTGTLTSLNLKVVRTEPEDISPEIKSIILGLERISYHPIAFAIREAWSEYNPCLLFGTEEKIGVGVSGVLSGVRYELLQDPGQDGMAVSLYANGKKLCSVFLETPVSGNAKEIVRTLSSFGIQSFLASGDLPAKAIAVGTQCAIPKNHIFGGLTPTDKKNLVQANRSTCMVGDGSNDALALKAADIGIAVKGSTFVNLQAADIYFTREGLQPLKDLFSLAYQTKKVLTRNLVFALIYNAVGGTLALLGFVNPLLAAVLMPVSSLLIISSTLWGFR